jgi:hypothetical protein
MSALITSFTQPLAEQNHKFKYMQVSSRSPLRVPVFVFFDNPVADGNSTLICYPGDVIPIRDVETQKGRAVYAFCQYDAFRGTTGSLWDSERIDFVFTGEGEEQGFFSKHYQPGEKIHDFWLEAGPGLAAGTSNLIFDSDWLRNINVGACYLHLAIKGGGVAVGGNAATAFPLELRLRETLPAGTEHGRVFLFPGGIGHADLIIPVPRHYHFSRADLSTSRWRLEAHHPTGSLVTIAAYSVNGALMAGDARESATYNLNGTRTAIQADAVANIADLICATQRDQGMTIRVFNSAGVAAMDGVGFCYVDTLNGGPSLDVGLQAITAAAGASQATVVTAIRSRHYVQTMSWAAGATGLGYSNFQSYGY